MVGNRNVFLTSVFLLLFTWIACEKEERKTQVRLPNIILINVDDLGFGDLSVYGHPEIKTPYLDKMAEQGARFTNFYSGSPACTASRYSLLTGKYPIRSGLDWVLYPNSARGIHPKEITLAEKLKDHAYRTAIFGKWHLGSTDAVFSPVQNGFEEYFGLPYSNDMIPPGWPAIPLMHNQDTLALNPDQTTFTEEISKRAKKFIAENTSEPFFLYLPYTMPHTPLFAGKQFKGTSKRGLYGDVVEELDHYIGEIIGQLKANKIEEKTLVIFTSDNGPWIIRGEEGGSAGLLKDGKGSTWEGGIRVPSIWYWPGNIENNIIRTPVGTVDVYSTVLSLVEGESMNLKDGKDLMPLLKNSIEHKSDFMDRTLFFCGLKNEILALRKGNWKLHIGTYSQTGQRYYDTLPLLFNLAQDPSEQYNKAHNNTELVQGMLLELDSFQTVLADFPDFYELERREHKEKHLLYDRLPSEMSLVDATKIKGITNGIFEDNSELGKLPKTKAKALVLSYALEELEYVEDIEIRFLRDITNWVVLPGEVRFEVAGNDGNFQTIKVVNHPAHSNSTLPLHKDFEIEVDQKIRYIRITAYNDIPLPSWHKGAGENGWLIPSEIVVD